jgi:hypothetical protein
MIRMRGFEDDLEKLKAVHTHGVLSVEARKLKSLLVPVAENALACMKRVLLQMARDKAKDVLTKYEQAIKQLSEKPSKLVQFAEWTKTWRQIKEMIQPLEEEKSHVEDMYVGLKNFRVKVPLDDNIQLENLNLRASEFERDKLTGAAEHYKETLKDMVTDMQTKAGKIEEDMKSISMELTQGSCCM